MNGTGFILTKEQAQKKLLFIHRVFIGFMFLQIVAVLRARKEQPSVDPLFAKVFLVVALVNATAVLVLRFFVIPKVDGEAAQQEVGSAKRQVFYLIAFALSEAVWAFGLMQLFIGEPLSTALVLLSIGLVLMLLCTPRQV